MGFLDDVTWRRLSFDERLMLKASYQVKSSSRGEYYVESTEVLSEISQLATSIGLIFCFQKFRRAQ